MKRIAVILTTMLLATAFARGDEAGGPPPAPAGNPDQVGTTTQPAQQPAQPALPPGHPPVPGMGGASKLPPGHPQIPGMGGGGQLPAGHPQIPGMGGGGQLPAGHPQIPGMGGQGQLPEGHPPVPGAGSAGPTTQPDVRGTLVVKAVQTTPGGASVAGDKVTVELFGRSMSAPAVEAVLNGHGVAILEGVQIGWGAQPVVTVEHQGVKFRRTGRLMSAASPDQHVKVEVCETTDRMPAWRVKARHMVLTPAGAGFRVREMVVQDNPTDRAWTGQADPDGIIATLDLTLAPNTGKVDLEDGFTQGATHLNERRLRSSLPLMPGDTAYRFGYSIPVLNGQAVLDIEAPAATGQLLVVVPEGVGKVSVEGLEVGQAMQMGPSLMRMYTARDVPAGRKVRLTIAVPGDAKGKAGDGQKAGG